MYIILFKYGFIFFSLQPLCNCMKYTHIFFRQIKKSEKIFFFITSTLCVNIIISIMSDFCVDAKNLNEQRKKHINKPSVSTCHFQHCIHSFLTILGERCKLKLLAVMFKVRVLSSMIPIIVTLYFYCCIMEVNNAKTFKCSINNAGTLPFCRIFFWRCLIRFSVDLFVISLVLFSKD